MSSYHRLFLVTSPPAPPPPGFSPDDMSLYNRPLSLRTPKVNEGSKMAPPGAKGGRSTTAELIAARESNILRACAPILPSRMPTTYENLLMLWCLALRKKHKIVTLLADIQLECEELECDVAYGLGEEIAQKTLRKVYDLGDVGNAKGRLMLSISNTTYKSVEKFCS